MDSHLPKRSFSHPLFGSSLQNLIRLLWVNGPVSFKHTPKLSAALASATLRLPFSILESLLYSKKLIQMEMKPPIFIIGHWRSGTTHISNLLSQSGKFGYVSPVATGIPHDLLLLGKWFKPWLERSIPPDRIIDRVAVNPASPQEDEFGMANIISISFLHALYFPKYFVRNFNKGVFFDGCSKKEITQWANASTKYLKKIYLEQHKRPLLVRNPAYTVRIPLLRKIWPGAKFIHIYRNPFKVYPSMRNYFEKLLPALAFQNFQHVEIEAVILNTYTRMMETITKDLAEIPHEEFVEIKFEQLEESPIKVLENVYSHLGLPGFGEDKPKFEQYLDGIRGYTKNQYQQNSDEIAMIKRHCQSFLDHYGY